MLLLLLLLSPLLSRAARTAPSHSPQPHITMRGVGLALRQLSVTMGPAWGWFLSSLPKCMSSAQSLYSHMAPQGCQILTFVCYQARLHLHGLRGLTEGWQRAPSLLG